MKKIFYRSGLAALVVASFLSGCKPEIDTPEVSAGEANFSKYVALGNSLTSGFADGALYRAGQEVSYPSILAQQFKLAGGGEFKQPLIIVGTKGDVGVGTPTIQGFNIKVASKLVLGTKTDCKGVTGLSPVPAAAEGDIGILLKGTSVNWIGDQGPFNNLGVPGALSYHLLAPGYGSKDLTKIAARQANPFFSRFASSDNVSIIQDAMAQNPTFFTLWIGNNDVLGYALSGGTGTITPPTGGNAANPSFDLTMGSLVNTLTSAGAKGAIGNIPDVTKVPYCTTIPYNGLTLDTTQAKALTGAYAALGMKFRVGSNPFVIADQSAPGGRRQMKPNELVLLSTPQDSLKCGGWGSSKPLANQYVLTTTEISNITDAVTQYNNIIRGLADSKGIALVDANSYLSSLQQGVTINQVNYNAALVTGNVFSLDGIHFSPRGNAIAANLFIEAINRKYNAKIPTVNVNAYSGVKFP